MHTFEQFVIQERQRSRDEKKPSLSPKQSKDLVYGHSAAKSYLDTLTRSGEDLSNYGITMTEIPKVGINPRSGYNTPFGVYFYPAEYYYDKAEHGDRLPYQHNAKYINILKFKSSSKVLHLVEDDKKYEKLWIELIKLIEWRDKEEILVHLREKYTSKGFTIARQFFYSIFEFSGMLTQTGPKGKAILANRLLAKLGIDIIIDSEGKGIIHENEPTQGFLMDGTKATVIKRFETNPPPHVNSRHPDQIMQTILGGKDYQPTPKEIAILATNGVSARQYAYHTKKRFPEGEPAIIKDKNIDVFYLYEYIRTFVKGPLPAAEDRIGAEGTADLVLSYAKNFLKGPFPKGEEAISKHPGTAFEYAKDVLKGRFIKGEPAIMKYGMHKNEYLELFGPI